MGIKFNCSNSSCGQRIEVDDAMAGKSISCPACATTLQIPSSADIKFNCSNPACGQHIVVNVSEAGRFIKCPACEKPLKIPGDPGRSLFSTWIKPDRQESQSLLTRKKSDGKFAGYAATWWGRLLLGWGVGALILCILITGLKYSARSALPPHMDEISDEIYLHGIGEFRDTPTQIIGDSMFYLHYFGEDVNVLRLNLSTLKETRITTIRTVSSDMGFVWLGFLPDGQHFAYCARGETIHGQSIVLGNITNLNQKKFILNANAKATDGFWLSDQSLILKFNDGKVKFLNLSTNVMFDQFGTNSLTTLFSLSNGNQEVAYVSSHSIAYFEKGDIWNFDLLDGHASKIVNFGIGALISDLKYSPQNQKYLFTKKTTVDAEGSDIYEYDTAAKTLKLLRPDAFGGQWMENGKACAFFEKVNGRRVLTIRKEDGTFFPSLFSAGIENLQSFTSGSDGKNVYGIVSDDCGTTLLSKYDVDARTYSKPYQLQGGYAHAKMTVPIEACTTNKSGEKVDYYYILPANYAGDKKYPVLVDVTSSTRHDHGRDPAFVANSGIFYVSPNKLGIVTWGVAPTEENTLAVYDVLMKNPHIDPHRIYIVGESHTTGVASPLVNEHPEMWRGLILTEPAVYPDISSAGASFPSILISIGDSDQGNGNGAPHNYGRAEEFLRSACAHFVPAHIYYQQNTPHAFQPEQWNATYKAVIEFILNDR